MDLQGTKEARKEEGEGPLEAYGAGGSRSKEYHKNEGRDSRNREDRTSIHPLRRRQPPFAYPHGSQRNTSSASTAAARPREPSPSPEAISIPQALGLCSRDQRLLRKARRSPPVTKKTLSELDLPCIMGNINLRMDANFDRDLHFKPDLDGEKGKRKRKEAADYWDSLALEIAIYSFRATCAATGADTAIEEVESSDGTRRTFDPRLPALFETLQDVIKTLVPERDHPTVTQNLEVPLLMQQIRKGVLDMLTLATWLAALLKTHCAPMRDEWADCMVEQIEKGSQSQDPREIVNGLQTLFAILEAMKLVSYIRSSSMSQTYTPLPGRRQSPDPSIPRAVNRRYSSIPTGILPRQNEPRQLPSRARPRVVPICTLPSPPRRRKRPKSPRNRRDAETSRSPLPRHLRPTHSIPPSIRLPRNIPLRLRAPLATSLKRPKPHQPRHSLVHL
jgi:hypothetical protein